MATIVLSAVGAAAGASIGGGVLGLSSVVIGRAIGATVGRALDQRLMGAGSAAVETGKVDRFRLTGASEGAPVAQVFGRMRMPGQVIWATNFKENTSTSGGGSKLNPQPSVTQYSYSTSLAIALTEGEISRVGRIWADGTEISRDDITMRVYNGSEDQLPDPLIEAVEGAGTVPAYRGMSYVVIEDLDLAPYGNRIPQFTFEVQRPAPENPDVTDLSRAVQGVALIPGTGEYALATTPVYYHDAPGQTRPANINTPTGKTDFATSLEALTEELPNNGSTSMVVSWFGDDLSAGSCTIRPKVEQTAIDGDPMAWTVSGQARASAAEVPKDSENRSVYGGTPADAAVIEGITALHDAGQEVVFYPFILMDQLDGNMLTDPYSGGTGQPALPWRGRITTSLAPGVAGSPDGTAAADAEVAAFFGTAQVSDFTQTPTGVSYSGPNEWSYRRFILHNAHLCAAAGGVEAFCIGSEMRGLTSIRGASGFPAVDALIQLAADVRAILGPTCKIGYAADWSEYFGHQTGGDVYFHLDPLWTDANIDFIGIDNYMPMSDWRDGTDHADAGYGAIYNLDYLKANIAGGEGFDWYYSSPEHRDAQIRSPITDGAHGEDWIFRYKDLKGWWSNYHHERIGGVRQAGSTAWEPGLKPIWFTEIGCAAIDKGTNQPNKFIDIKSSESALPHYSTGRRDDLVQMQYLRALYEFWAEDDNNPVSEVYAGEMVDMSRAHVWAWDARPYPFFPAQDEVWSDGENWMKGHWFNGRASNRSLADVVAEICAKSGVKDVDVSGLYGLVRGYSTRDVQGGREALQPLMLAYGFEAIERGGQLIFRSRDGLTKGVITPEMLALTSEQESSVEITRAPEAEIAGRLRLTFIDADGDYAARAEEAIFPGEETTTISTSELPLALTRSEGRQIVERWLAESRVARDTARFALPPSAIGTGAGDVVTITSEEGTAQYRIDHATIAGASQIEAVRVEPGVYQPSDAVEEVARVRAFAAPVPVYPLFLDLPLLRGDEVAHAPHVAATATPWPGSVAVYQGLIDDDYALNTLLAAPATIGITQTGLGTAAPGIWDRGAALRVTLSSGALSSVSEAEVLSGANLAAIGDGSSGNWEVFQFANATLVSEGTYDITLRLRGQAGTDGLLASWPAGSQFVLLDSVPRQIDLALSARGLARHYRVGPSARPVNDPSFLHSVEAFDGIGLRPYAPAHLRASRDGAGDLTATWVRRTRIDGDSWQGTDVPLGEDVEAYRVRVLQGSAVMRELTVPVPTFSYPVADQTADGVTAPFDIHVAQISTAFGVGLFKRITIND